MPAGASLCPGFAGVPALPVLLHILLTAANIANAVVVDLHSLGRVLRPLYLFLVDYDPLNEQPQQLRRQFRDIRVPLCLIKEAVRPARRFPQALDLTLFLWNTASDAVLFFRVAAGEHLEHLGLPYDRLYQEGIVFLLSKAGVRIHRCPTAADLLWVETSPQSVRGAQYNREIRVYAEENGGPGELLAEIHTVWFMQIRWSARSCVRRSSPIRCPPFRRGGHGTFGAARFRVTGEECGEQAFTVRYSHLDVNGHLNNTVYGDLVCDVLPFEELVNRGIREFRIVFRHEARYGEELRLQLFHDREEDCWYVTGHRADGPCFEAQVVLNDTEQSEDSVR